MAEEIGRRIALELSSHFAQIGRDLLAQQSKLSFAAENFATLRHSIAVALRGFNEVVARDFRLTMLSGQNCLVFSFETRLALTLKVDIGRIRLLPALPRELKFTTGSGVDDHRPSIEFDVTREENSFRYQRIAIPPAFQNRVLSESEFIDGVIRLACSQPFERT